MDKPIVVVGIVTTNLLCMDRGVPEYCGSHEIPDVAIEDGDELLTLDYLLPFEGRRVRVTIEVLDGPPSDDEPHIDGHAEGQSWGHSVSHSTTYGHTIAWSQGEATAGLNM